MPVPLTVVIPAYRPDPGLPARVAAFQKAGFAQVVVVDDGSGEASRPVFGALPRDGVTLLVHAANQGKGQALKTAFAYVLKTFPASPGVVTADADGQHDPADARRVAEALRAAPQTAVLGVRSFRLGKVPFRSWWGNRWTSLLFGAIYWRWLADTQTGLRAFSRDHLPRLLAIPGRGYEYEMAVLCRFARAGIPFAAVPIRTIYEKSNPTSHFRPLQDTLRIFRVLFAHACRLK